MVSDNCSKTPTRTAETWRASETVVVLAVLALSIFSDFFGTLERRYYDFASTSTSRQPSDRIAIIAIDDQSIANIGRWPWPRDVHAKLIDMLAAANAKTIAYTVFFFEPQTDRGLTYIRKMKDVLGSADAAASAPAADAATPPAPAAGSAPASASTSAMPAAAPVALSPDAQAMREQLLRLSASPRSNWTPTKSSPPA